MVQKYDRTESLNWSTNDQITAVRLQDFNDELDWLFARLDDRNLALTYNWNGQLITIVDSINSITINISWVDWEAPTPKLYIQEAGDPKKFTVTYLGDYPSTSIYA